MFDAPVDRRLLDALLGLSQELGTRRPLAPAPPLALGTALDALDALVTEHPAAPVGLLLAERLPLLMLGELGLAFRASDDLEAGLTRLTRFHSLSAPFVEIKLSPVDRGKALELRYRIPERPCRRAIVEGGLAMWVRFGREATGVPWTPRRVVLPHVPTPGPALASFFGAAVVLGPHAALELDAAVLSLPLRARDSVVTDFVDTRAEAQLARLLEERFAARLEGWLGERLEQGPTAEEAAAAFRMARRTLHRRLRAAGTTFQALHQRLLRERAHRLLAAGCAVSEVADRLGYADTSSFCRAYRMWTGRSPAGQRGAFATTAYE